MFWVNFRTGTESSNSISIGQSSIRHNTESLVVSGNPNTLCTPQAMDSCCIIEISLSFGSEGSCVSANSDWKQLGENRKISLLLFKTSGSQAEQSTAGRSILCQRMLWAQTEAKGRMVRYLEKRSFQGYRLHKPHQTQSPKLIAVGGRQSTRKDVSDRLALFSSVSLCSGPLLERRVLG